MTGQITRANDLPDFIRQAHELNESKKIEAAPKVFTQTPQLDPKKISLKTAESLGFTNHGRGVYESSDGAIWYREGNFLKRRLSNNETENIVKEYVKKVTSLRTAQIVNAPDQPPMRDWECPSCHEIVPGQYDECVCGWEPITGEPVICPKCQGEIELQRDTPRGKEYLCTTCNPQGKVIGGSKREAIPLPHRKVPEFFTEFMHYEKLNDAQKALYGQVWTDALERVKNKVPADKLYQDLLNDTRYKDVPVEDLLMIIGFANDTVKQKGNANQWWGEHNERMEQQTRRDRAEERRNKEEEEKPKAEPVVMYGDKPAVPADKDFFKRNKNEREIRLTV